MTLTREDLSAISQLLDTKLDSKLQVELRPLKDDISNIKSEISSIKADVSNLKADVSNLKAETSNFNSRFQALENEVRDIRLHLENVTDKNIQLLAENYVPAAKRYEKASAQMDTLKNEIQILKKVVADHSEKLHNFA